MSEVRLHTKLDEFHDLHGMVDCSKRTVRVDRQALLNLLLDHTQLIVALGTHRVKDPAPVLSKKRLRIV